MTADRGLEPAPSGAWMKRSGSSAPVGLRQPAPVELGDRAALDTDLARPRAASDPERVGTLAEAVEDEHVLGAAPGRTLEDLLVAAPAVVCGAADLHLCPAQPGVGVDDQRTDVLADLEHDVLGVGMVAVARVVVRAAVCEHLS